MAVEQSTRQRPAQPGAGETGRGRPARRPARAQRPERVVGVGPAAQVLRGRRVRRGCSCTRRRSRCSRVARLTTDARRAPRRGPRDDHAAGGRSTRPSELRAGTRDGDRAFEGLLSYARRDRRRAGRLPRAGRCRRAANPSAALVAEARSLTRHARVAERLERDDRDREPGAALPRARRRSRRTRRCSAAWPGASARRRVVDLPRPRPRPHRRRPAQHVGRAAVRAGARPGQRLPRPRQPRRPPQTVGRQARRRPAAPRPAPAARARNAAVGPGRAALVSPSRPADLRGPSAVPAAVERARGDRAVGARAEPRPRRDRASAGPARPGARRPGTRGRAR